MVSVPGGAGRPMQLAFVTDDIHRDMAALTRAIGAGPWFLREDTMLANQRFRGQPARARLSLAMAWAGPMLYELIHQTDDSPSVFREVLEAGGAGIHHLGVAAQDFEAAMQGYNDLGYSTVFEAQVAHGARIAYVSADRGVLPMIEVIEALPQTLAMLDSFRNAHENWDGTQPVRPLAPMPG